MGELAASERVEVAAPAHELWLLRWDFSRLPEYNADVSDVRLDRAPRGEGAAGARFAFTLATPAGPHPVTLEVTESVPDRLVAATMAGAMSASERFEVEALDDGRASATLRLWLELPADVDEALRRRLVEGGRSQIRHELDAMRTLLEGEES